MKAWEGRHFEVKVLCSVPGVAQHIWISTDRGAILIDVGDGILRDLRSEDLDCARIAGVIMTHGHFDHVGGLYSLLGYLRLIGRSSPLPICIPKGSQEVPGIVRNFVSSYQDTMPYGVPVREIEPYEVFDIAGMSMEAHPVVHCGGIATARVLDQIPAFGYRISFAGEIVAVTGDTGLCSTLEGLVKDADLALIEATLGDARGASHDMLEKVHLSEKAARELGSLAKAFILIHKGERT